MKALKEVLAYISSCKIWLIALACANVLFIFFAWFAYPEEFYSLIWLMVSVSVGTSFIPLFIFSETTPQAANRISPFSYGA